MLLNFRSKASQLSPDVAEKLSGLMRSGRFSGEQCDLAEVDAPLSFFLPTFDSSWASFVSKASTVSPIVDSPDFHRCHQMQRARKRSLLLVNSTHYSNHNTLSKHGLLRMSNQQLGLRPHATLVLDLVLKSKGL